MASGFSGSSGSSYSSSSVRYPPSYRQAQTSPLDSAWTTPTSRSTVSAITSHSSQSQPTPLRPLDLGPPGYQATITLFERTVDETTIYLGPWDFESAGVDHRRLSWQCSYQGEVLEHYLRSAPSDAIPLTHHAHHRRFENPKDMELYVNFNERQRIRYVAADGSVLHDAFVDVRYVFATFDNSLRFQSDLRRRELVDFFDIDVVWSDREDRRDRFGAVRGMATGQRVKLWKDMYSSYHSLTFLAGDNLFREYPVSAFEREIRRDDAHRRLRVYVRGRRSSTHDPAPPTRRVSFPFRSRRSADDTAGSQASSSHQAGGSPSSHGLHIRYLGLQFSRPEDYERFIQQWDRSCAEDSAFNGVPFPLNHIELPSAEIHAADAVELPAGSYSMLETVSEPSSSDAP